jgi:hypothetical protein
MRSQEAAARLRHAEHLFQAGEHTDALAALEALNQESPNTPEVLYGMVQCHARLGNRETALEGAHYLKRQCGDPRADQLIAHLEAQGTAAPEQPQPFNPDDLADMTPVAEPEDASRWRFRFPRVGALGWAAIVAIGAVCFAVPAVISYLSDPVPDEAGAAYWANRFLLEGIDFIIGFATTLPVFYLVLSIMGKHPGENWRENLPTAAVCVLLIQLTAMLPYVSIIFWFFILTGFYDFEILELVVYVLITLAINLLIAFALAAIAQPEAYIAT